MCQISSQKNYLYPVKNQELATILIIDNSIILVTILFKEQNG